VPGELLPQRQPAAVATPQCGQRFRIGVAAAGCERLGRVAGQNLEQEEVEHRDEHQRQQGAEHFAQRVPEPGGAGAALGSTAAGRVDHYSRSSAVPRRRIMTTPPTTISSSTTPPATPRMSPVLEPAAFSTGATYGVMLR